MSRIHGQGSSEKPTLYDPGLSVAFFKGYETVVAEDAVNSFTELQYRTGLQYVKLWYLTDILPTKKIAKLF